MGLFVAMGMATGLRTMTPMAVFCWAAYLGFLPQDGWAMWAGKLITVIIFTIFALGEYVGDTLPQTPSRTSAFPLIARIAFGAVVGALCAKATEEPVAGGVIFGAIGAVAGAYGGYWLRAYFAKKVGRDLPVALVESALALGWAIYGAYTFHMYYVFQHATT